MPDSLTASSRPADPSASEMQNNSARIGRQALILGLISVLAALLLGYGSYKVSVNSSFNQFKTFYMNKATLLAAVGNEAFHHEGQEILESIEKAWRALPNRPVDEYICIVDKECRLILHSAYPETVSDYVGENWIGPPDATGPRCLRELAANPELLAGEYISSAGDHQIAAFVPIPSLGWLLGVHRSEEALLREARSHFLWLGLAFLFVCCLLIPLALFIFHRAVNQEFKLRHAIEDILKAEKGKYRSLFENQMDGVALADQATGIILDCNQAMVELTGWPRAALIGKPQVELHPPDQNINGLSVTYRKHSGDDKGACLETKLLTRDGMVREVNIRGSVIELNHQPVALGVFRDITEWKQAEQALRESEQKYQLLFNKMLDAFALHEILCDEDGKPCDYRFLEVNPAFEEMTGLKSMDLIGRRVREVLPGTESYWIEMFGQVALTGASIVLEHFSAELDRYYRVSAYRPKRHQFACIFMDVTQRKQAENRLAKEKLFLQKAQEIGKIGTWEIDVSSGRIYWTEENYRIFGIPPERAVTYDTFLDCVHPADRDWVAREWAAALAGKPYDIVHRIHVNGQVRWVREKAELFFDKSGHCLSATGLTQDITERQKTEQQNRQMQQILRSLWELSTMEDASLITLCDNILEFMVEMSASQYGFYGFLLPDESEMVLHAWSHETMVDCDSSALGTHFPIDQAGVWAECVRKREILILNDFSNPHPAMKGIPEGHVPMTRILAVPVFRGDHIVAVGAVANKSEDYTTDDAEQVQRFLTNAQFLTDRKRSEAERGKLQEQLLQSQKMEAVGQLAGGVAHDFNNILQVIIGYADIAKEASQIPEAQTSLDEVLAAADRARELVSQLLAFSRHSRMERKHLDIGQVVVEMTKMIRRVIGENITLTTELAAEDIIVYADRGQLEQVLLNLCVNARDAMPNGGELILSTGHASANTVAPNREGEWAWISVSDTGTGMSAQTMERIFEPFFTTKGVGEGTGLGLAGAFGIIEQHGGFITVDSELGAGASFHVYLPLADEKTDASAETPTPSIRVTGSETIFMAEDDDALRRLNAMLLKQAGYRVLTATNGEEAIAILGGCLKEIDLLVLDVIMPKKSGRDVYDWVIKERPDLPILFLTGYSSERLQQQELLPTDCDMMTKPSSPKDFLGRIRALLNKREQ